jgi:hypothetical protein
MLSSAERGQDGSCLLGEVIAGDIRERQTQLDSEQQLSKQSESAQDIVKQISLRKS